MIDELSYFKLSTEYRSTEPKELRNMFRPCIRKYIICTGYCSNVDFNVYSINDALVDVEIILK